MRVIGWLWFALLSLIALVASDCHAAEISLAYTPVTQGVLPDGSVVPVTVGCYNFERGAKDDGSDFKYYPAAQQCGTAVAYKFTDLGLVEGTRFCYRVYAVANGVNGTPSNIVCKVAATPKPAPKASVLSWLFNLLGGSRAWI